MTQNERENILKMFLSNDKETQLLACDLIITHPNFEKIKNKELKKTFFTLGNNFDQVKVPIIKIIQSIKSIRTNYDESRDFFDSYDIKQILQLL